MRGRKPTPTSLKVLEGNPGHRPLNGSEPKPPATLPDPPDALSAAAKKMWRRIGPKFAALGVIAEVDEAAFAVLCESYTSWLKLIELARENGPVVLVNGQPVPNPYAVRADKEAEKMRKMLAEFGGSPSSRSRLSTTNSSPEDDLNSFLNGEH
jgi:P27 family predicted phage terminase small subunit